MATWLNSDGLFIKLGVTEAQQGVAGEYSVPGAQRVDEIALDLTTLTTTAGTIIEDGFMLPAGARIEKVEIVTVTAATSAGSATLDIGLRRSDRSTQLDYDGLVAALAKTAYDAAGETNSITVGSTGAGALIGTTLANNGLLCANWNTAAYTAGKIAVRIYWSNPT